jgi:hypothetical protein
VGRRRAGARCARLRRRHRRRPDPPQDPAVKDSTGDFQAISRLISEAPPDFEVYSGDDKLTTGNTDDVVRGGAVVPDHGARAGRGDRARRVAAVGPEHEVASALDELCVERFEIRAVAG